MDYEKSVLIVTDDSEACAQMAQAIAAELHGVKITHIRAGEFVGTHLLGAALCFIGCARPNPPEFAAFEKVLLHINLALRGCGLFTPVSPEAAEYLAGIVKDCGIKVHGPPMVSSSSSEIKEWAQNIAKREELL